ncbi:MAG: hypothetical protein WD801_10845 [Gemmatimonadaceae bacterium]
MALLPGLTLVSAQEWRRGEPIELAALACAGSAAWWSVGLWWFVGLAGIPLLAFAIASLAAAVAVLVYRRGVMAPAAATWRLAPGPALLAAGFIAAVVATRVIFAYTRLGGSTGDMTAHAYVAELIVMRNGLPDTYEPFLPIGNFGSFPPGFHALAAIETLLSGVPAYRSTIHVACFAVMALTFSLAALLRGAGVSRAGAALGALAALVLARNPQFFVQWGGTPTLLAAAIVFLVLRDALRLAEPRSPAFVARLGLLSAGALTVHPLPVVSFLYVFPVAAALSARREWPAWRSLARNGVLVLTVAGVLALPFFARAPLDVPPEASDYARHWFRLESEQALMLQTPALERLGALSAADIIGPHTWPFHVVTYLGVLPAALLAFGLAARCVREARTALAPATRLAVALVALHFLLYAAALTEWLPLWQALYPTRIGIWLAPALAIAIAGLMSLLAARLSRRVLYAVGIAWIVLFSLQGYRLSAHRFGRAFYGSDNGGVARAIGVVANESVGGAFWHATLNRDNAVLAEDDLVAFAWVRAHTPADALFATNYGDAGGLLPAVARRRILEPHFSLSFYHLPDLARMRNAPADYIYVSAEASPVYSLRYVAEALDTASNLELAFRAGEARVYRVRR